MTKIIRPATKEEIIQTLLEELGPDHPLAQDIQHGYLHFPPTHVDIAHGQLSVWREDDEGFSARIPITHDNLKDVHLIIMSILRTVNELFDEI